MKIGFLTACLPRVHFEEIVPWAAKQGFKTLELAAWPDDSRRDYQARHVAAESFTKDDARRMNDLLAEHGMAISAFAYYDNNLHPDLKKRAGYHRHLHRVIDAAALLGVKLVGTFVGGRPVLPTTVMKEIGEIFRGIVAYAEDRGVRVMIENCPMDNWVQWGLPGNYAFSPELWDALFNEVPSDNFGLNFDPSHLYWLGIDHLRAARDYAGRIFHVHAKDAEILEEGRNRFGILSEQLAGNRWKSGWWRYRMPGKGNIDWTAFIDTLQEIGYDGALSIEHEDPEYEGSEEAVKEGLRLGLSHLQKCGGAKVA
jgi:sugar phosphate isomerase/epimerase